MEKNTALVNALFISNLGPINKHSRRRSQLEWAASVRERERERERSEGEGEDIGSFPKVLRG